MAVSYKKLWKLLIDRDMKKKELARLAGISNFTISKMSAGNNVTVEVLGKICKALNCTLNSRQPDPPPDKGIGCREDAACTEGLEPSWCKGAR